MKSDQGFSVFEIKFVTTGTDITVMTKKNSLFWSLLKETNENKALNETCDIIVDALRRLALEIEDQKDDFFTQKKIDN